MQRFESTGLLPPGIHKYDFHEFKTQFVDSFPNSTTREKIFIGFKIFISSICRIVKPSELWVDGSFVTSKVNPNDIDLVLFFEKVSNPIWYNGLEPLLNISKNYFCDAYACPIDDIHWRGYWRGFFGFDRLENPKGIIKINPLEVATNLSEVVKYA